MRAFKLLFFLTLVCLSYTSLAFAKPVQQALISPLPDNKALVWVDVPSSTPIEVTLTTRSEPAIILRQTRLSGPKHFLGLQQFTSVPPYTVALEAHGQDTWIVFHTQASLLLNVLTSRERFNQQAIALAPLYRKHQAVHFPKAYTPQYLIGKAASSFLGGHESEAIDALTVLNYQTTTPPKALYKALAGLHLREKNWVQALDCYSQAAKDYPGSVSVPYASLLIMLNQPDKAISLLKDHPYGATGLNRNQDAQARYMLGTLYLEKKLYDKAIDQLKLAQVVFEKNPVLSYNLGVAYQGVGEHEVALAAYQKALVFSQVAEAKEVQSQIKALTQPIEFTPVEPSGHLEQARDADIEVNIP
jgi:tetratricopeptide (TPR) repeat protein